ncbi:MAG: lysophospholipid acyltransferase family protein, partial [Sphingomonas sp.]
GWAARRYGVIVVDREASAGALRRMVREAKVALAAGRSILIYPEGTRVAPGEHPPLRAGFAGLYQMLKVPVVPVAIDSGKLWPKHGAKHAGVVTFRFGAPIPPGLPRDDVEALVHTAINALD